VALPDEGSPVKKERPASVRRRDLLRTVMTGAAAAAVAGTVVAGPAEALPRNSADKSKARYRASATEVQEFYRVNRYPVR
jgi:nitrous oxide reductase